MDPNFAPNNFPHKNSKNNFSNSVGKNQNRTTVNGGHKNQNSGFIGLMDSHSVNNILGVSKSNNGQVHVSQLCTMPDEKIGNCFEMGGLGGSA